MNNRSAFSTFTIISYLVLWIVFMSVAILTGDHNYFANAAIVGLIGLVYKDDRTKE